MERKIVCISDHCIASTTGQGFSTGMNTSKEKCGVMKCGFKNDVII